MLASKKARIMKNANGGIWGAKLCQRQHSYSPYINPYPLLPFLSLSLSLFLKAEVKSSNLITQETPLGVCFCCHGNCLRLPPPSDGQIKTRTREQGVLSLLQVHFDAVWRKLDAFLQLCRSRSPNPLTHLDYYKCFSNTSQRILFTRSWREHVQQHRTSENYNDTCGVWYINPVLLKNTLWKVFLIEVNSGALF